MILLQKFKFSQGNSLSDKERGFYVDQEKDTRVIYAKTAAMA